MDPRLPVHLRAAELDDEAFVSWIYTLGLRREPEEDAREDALERLRERKISRTSLLAEMVATDEFALAREFDDAVTLANRARRNGDRMRELTGPAWLDERVIEIPWVLSRYHDDEHVLDIGYAYAEPSYLLGLLELEADQLVGVDLAEPFPLEGMETVTADVRSLPFKNEAFDLVFCVSTLEHIGRDNTRYGVRTLRRGGMESALRELRRVLAAKGRLLISVPTGAEEEHDWFVQHSPAGWLQLFDHAGFHTPEHEIYELQPEGWRSVDELADIESVRYGERGKAASAVLCAELHVNPDVGPSLRERVREVTHR
jgi:O-antigen chain-terminating methyltransferase